MLCNICHKNTATIHIQEIVGNEKKTLHLCQECATKKAQEDSSFQALNLAEVLYNISNQLSTEKKEDNAADQEHSGIFCTTCGWDYASFRKTGRLGCPDCYNAFYETLKSAIGAMHRGTTHTGKIPGTFQGKLPKHKPADRGILKRELEKLQNNLNIAVANEEFERAAILRDKINELKEQLKGDTHADKA